MPQHFFASRVRFLGEQDGPSERLLKNELRQCFLKRRSIGAAYLARVDIGHTLPSVALCIVASTIEEVKVAQEIQTIFAAIFDRREHMEVLFLTPRLHQEVARVCSPFYTSAMAM